MRTDNALVLDERQHETVQVLGDRISFIATHEHTANQWSLFDVEIAPGNGPPFHLHTNMDEAYYLLSGEVDVTIASMTRTVAAGDFIFIPRNKPHTYKNRTLQTCRMLIVTTPAGMESFFREISSPRAQEDILQIAARHNIQVI